MTKNLEELRRKIDALDNKIHDVLMERAELIVDIAEEKRKAGLQYVQPSREAMMIRRLMKRHQGALPQGAVVRIWRELVGAVSLMQTGLKVSVSTGKDGLEIWEMARNYFGSVVPMQKASSSLVAISSVRDTESSFAVLPWPFDGEDNPWWTHLYAQQGKERMKIVCALPYGSTEEEKKSSAPEDKALVVAKIDFISSGEDCSFIGLEVDQRVSRARVVDVLKKIGFNVIGLNTKSRPDPKGHSLHLVEVEEFIAEDDKRLTKILEEFEAHGAKCVVLGGYPVTPVYKGLQIKSPAKPEARPDKKKSATRS